MTVDICSRLCSNGDLDLHTGLDVDDDLLDDFGGGVEIDKTLVNSHFEHVPCLATLTARGLTGGHLQGLGGQTNWALDTEVLGLCALEEFRADLLERLDFARGKGDANLVDFLDTTSVNMRKKLDATVHVLAPRRNPSLAFGKTFSRLKCR